MEFGVVFFVISACLLCAAVVFMVGEYRRHGERHDDMKKILNAQAEAGAVRKEIEGFSKYNDYLASAKQLVADRAKPLSVKVRREQFHIETIGKEPQKLKLPVTIIVKYMVEFTVGLNLKPGQFDIVPSNTGLTIQVSKPVLLDTPMATAISSDITVENVLPDAKVTLAEVHKKLPLLARKLGDEMAGDEALAALCEKKLTDLVSTFLAGQNGVKLVPTITVVYK
jgi:hypothetical protein